MPKFLSREEIYRMLQRELPPNVYPDGAPEKFYSTADMNSIAEVVAAGYENLSEIYDNNWPQTATHKLADWEMVAFGFPLEAALTLEQRRDRTVAKIRSRKGLTGKDMVDVVKGIIGTDKLVDVSEWGCLTGGWLISESQLGIETILNGQNLVDVTGTAPCADPADFGKSPAEWAEMQEEAYTYQVNIYGYTLTAKELAALDQALTIAEPARSRHVIVDGLDPNDMIEGDN
jgi:hypothetical protein